MTYIDELCGRLRYDNGKVFWINAGIRTDRNGMEAGSVSKTDGYVYVKFRQKRIGVHRVVYYMHHGVMPSEIDHINRVRNDNRIENLREATTHSQNGGNQSLQTREKTSKFKGVCWDKNRCKWMASIKFNGKRMYLGRYEDEVSAARAYNTAATNYFGEFANLNEV